MIAPEAFVHAKDVYGVRKYYPACQVTARFSMIAGTKTLSKEVIDHMKALGYSVKVVSPEIV